MIKRILLILFILFTLTSTAIAQIRWDMNIPRGSSKILFWVMPEGLECVVVAQSHRSNLTCNWEKFNKEREAKKDDK